MCFHTLAQLERSVQVAMTQNCGRVLGIVIKGVDCSVKWNLAIIAYYIRQRDKSSSFISLMEFQVRHANLKIHAVGKLFSYEMYSLYLVHLKKGVREKALVTFWKVRLAWKPAADSSFSANSATKAFLIAVVVGVLRLERPQLHFPRVLQLIISSLLRKLYCFSGLNLFHILSKFLLLTATHLWPPFIYKVGRREKRNVERGKCHCSKESRLSLLHILSQGQFYGETRLLRRDYPNLGLVITLAFLLAWPLGPLQGKLQRTFHLCKPSYSRSNAELFF